MFNFFFHWQELSRPAFIGCMSHLMGKTVLVQQEGDAQWIPKCIVILQRRKENHLLIVVLKSKKISHKTPGPSDLLLACTEPLLKPFYHGFRAFKEHILAVQEESETPLPATSLLKRFNHVSPEEIPSSLPQKRNPTSY